MSTSLSEVNKINLINIQPTTKYVDKNGPSTNPEYYVKKVDLDKQLSNIPTKDNVVSISKNLITNALDNYYDKDYIDGQLSCKSNTDHTHTNIYNELTINSNSFKLLSAKNTYTHFTLGKKDKNYESAVIGYGDDYKGKYLYMRVNGGEQLTLYGDKATLPVDLTVSTLNGIDPSTISLNTHNHDDKYASKEHTHSFNDLEDKPELALANHTHTEFNNDVAFKTNVSIYDKLNDICVPLASEHMCFLGDPYFPFVDSRGDCWIGDSLTFYLDGGQDKSLGFYSNSESSLSIYNNNNKKLIGFGEDKNRPGTETVDTYLEFNRSDSTTSYEWRIYSLSNHNLDFVNYQGTRAGYINCISNAQMNITITHNAPLTEDLDKYKIGAPVFMSGKVYKLIDGKYVDRTDTTDCIPSVKAEGKYKEYLGIIVAKHKAGETVTVGDVVKQDVIIDQDTIDFATHGDFYLEVNDASSYKVGDTILYNGDIVNDEEPMTNKIQRMIAGVITAIVGASTLAIFKT